MGSLQGLGYELEYREYLVLFPIESEDSFFQNVLSENGAHTTSYSVLSRGTLPVGKKVRHKTDHKAPSGIVVQKRAGLSTCFHSLLGEKFVFLPLHV